MILITTSRRPTQIIRSFCKDLTYTFPETFKINRGKLNLYGLAEKAMKLKAEKVLIVNRWKGGPGKIELYEVGEGGLKPIPPLIYVRSVLLRRNFKAIPHGKRIKSIALETDETISRETRRLEEALSNFFSIPIVKHEAAQEGFDAVMQVKESHQGLNITFSLTPKMVEIGPRIRISHLIWDLKSHEGSSHPAA